jgi:hypothetical protein
MSIHECPRVDDAAGYVLRALPEGEWESYRYHVAECEDCTQKVAELGFVSHALLSAAPQLSAPPDIRNRVMSVVRAESELLQAAGATADRPIPKPARRRGFGFGRLGPLTVGALAATLLVVGLGAGALLRDNPSCATRAAGLTAPGSKASLEVCDGSARLALTGMPAPPDGRIYELWTDDPKDRLGPQPAGLFSVRNGKASVDVGRLRGHAMVLVTHEPLPNGSEVPSVQPIVKVVA